LEGYLVSLDAKKAFDSIDHSFMLDVLKEFNFSSKFIHIVKTLYTKLTADVMVNGIRYGLLKILKGVKQGDSLSCVLFILCMEVLIKNIERNDNIVGIEINNTVVKQSIFADDLSPLVKTIDSINEIFKEYSKFSSFSGIKLNNSKTEILPLGAVKNRVDPIVLNQDNMVLSLNMMKSIKIGGIWFGYDKSEIKIKNIDNRIEKMKTILNSWRFANFSLEGNIIIAKTFGLSQFIHLMQSIHIGLDDLKKIESIIYNFIWRGVDKIKRSTLCLDYENGGLKSPNPIITNMCLKLKIFFRLSFTQIDHPIKEIWLNSKELENENITCNLKSINQKEYLLFLKDKNCSFVKICFNSYKYYNSLWKSHLNIIIRDNPCHIQYKVLFANADISSLVNLQTKDIAIRLKNRYNIVKLIDLIASNRQNIYLEKRSVIGQIPDIIKRSLTNNVEKYRNLINNIDHTLICKDPNSWINLKKLKSINLLYLEQSGLNLNENYILNNINLFVHCRKSTKNVRLRDFQFKLLHKITSTRSKIYKYKYIENDHCLACSEEGVNIRDTIEHSFYNCPKTSQTWINFEKICNEKFGIEIDINLENCTKTFGFKNKVLEETSIIIKKSLHSPMSLRKVIACDQVLKIINQVTKVIYLKTSSS